jgi:thiol-disulfide isomerase/thioredoxin
MITRMMRLVLIALLLSIGQMIWAQSDHSISVIADGYDGDEIYLGVYLGELQFVLDTARLLDGEYRFEGEENLLPGFYIVVFPPDNQFLQLLIGEDDTDIQVKVKASSLRKPTELNGSEDTRLFYMYAEYISEKRTIVDSLKSERDDLPANSKRKTEIENELEAINAEVVIMQNQIVEEHGETLTAMLININREVNIPDFEGTEEEINDQTFEYYREHYFDHIPLSDPRIVRTPFLHEKLSYYLEKLTYQHPDSLIIAIDFIMNEFGAESESFQVYLASFLNKYARSKIVGMDAVYVHLVNEYYAQGKAPWTDEEQLSKIIKNANTLKPILIGKIAPDLKLQSRDKEPITVHGIKSDYTVLFFWDPECGHCKKSIPLLLEFYKAYHDRGVEVLAICTKLNQASDKCWDVVDERGMDIWINANDPYLRSKFKQIYDIRVTPQIFVLDSDKKIVMKKIGVEQLAGVMDHLLGEKSD